MIAILDEVGTFALYGLCACALLFLSPVRSATIKVVRFLFLAIDGILLLFTQKTEGLRTHFDSWTLIFLPSAICIIGATISLVTPTALSNLIVVILFLYLLSIIRSWFLIERYWSEERILVPRKAGKFEVTPFETSLLSHADLRLDIAQATVFFPVLCAIFIRNLHYTYVLFDVPANVQLVEWFYFILAETVKAIPLFDWSEIYEWKNPSLIRFNAHQGINTWTDSGRNVIFLFRVFLDIIIIGTILQILKSNKLVKLGLRPRYGLGTAVEEESVLQLWLRSPITTVRQNACYSLAQNRPKHEDTMRELVALLQIEDDEYVRQAALLAVEKWYPIGHEAELRDLGVILGGIRFASDPDYEHSWMWKYSYAFGQLDDWADSVLARRGARLDKYVDLREYADQIQKALGLVEYHSTNNNVDNYQDKKEETLKKLTSIIDLLNAELRKKP